MITAGDELDRGQVVGKECDHGADVLLTHHASRRRVCPPAAHRWPRHGLLGLRVAGSPALPNVAQRGSVAEASGHACAERQFSARVEVGRVAPHDAAVQHVMVILAGLTAPDAVAWAGLNKVGD